MSARTLFGDGPTDNLARKESLNDPDMGGVVDGINTVFPVLNYPITTIGTVWNDGVVTTAYTADEITGEITFTVAPTTSAAITYYYELMSDDSWTEFVTAALERLGLSTGIPSVDIPNVPEGLLAALKTYSGAAWAQRISSQSGLWYNQKFQERQEDRDTISRKFLTLAQSLWKDGDNQRTSFYQGNGAQYKPGFKIVQFTPKQYTPCR